MAKVQVYTKNFCPYCDSAKRLLKSLNIPFGEDNLEDKPEERARLSALAGGYRTMPMIWIGDEFIGGFSDLDALHKAGQLLKKVNG